MIKKSCLKAFCPVLLMLLTFPLQINAEEKKSNIPTTTQSVEKAKPRLTVAIIDFEVGDNRINPNLGKQVSELLTAMLADEPSVTLVDRATMNRVLQEQELNLTGLVSTEQAIQIGKMVGSRILVTGKAFVLGEQVFITAKLIGTETTLVDGVMVKGKSSSDMGELVVQLSEKIARRLRDLGPKLVAGLEIVDDPVPALKEKLAKAQLPTVAVIVPEQHVAQRLAATADPAVETEVKKLLQQCGFAVMDVKQNELADWARDWKNRRHKPWPRSLDRVDVVVTGEAFSEYAARIGNIISCAARAEVNVISRKDGRIIIADRSVARAVDLSENIAGRKALQKAGRTIGIDILRYFAENQPAVQTTQPAKP